jgi:hypothetical protein
MVLLTKVPFKQTWLIAHSHFGIGTSLPMPIVPPSYNLHMFLLLLLPFPQKSALHRVHPSWTESGHCPRTREERKVHGLITYQARICTRLPELIPHLITAASQTVDVCQWTFADRRWNCSSVMSAPNLSAELNSGQLHSFS